MRRVMISYSHAQDVLARELHAAVAAAGHAPKLDCIDLHAGDLWRDRLASWMAACDTAIVLLCPNAASSDWVRHEISVLTNRTRVGDGLQLVLVALGVDPAEVARHETYEPIDLAAFQVTLKDSDVPTIVQVISPDEPGDSPQHRLAGSLRSTLQDGGVRGQQAHQAHACLNVAVVNQRDAWLSRVPANPDEESIALDRFARDLCEAGIGDVFAPLDWLREHNKIVELGTIVDRVLQSYAPPALVEWCCPDTVERSRPVDRVAVAPLTTTDFAHLAASSVAIVWKRAPPPIIYIVHTTPTSSAEDRGAMKAAGQFVADLQAELDLSRTEGRDQTFAGSLDLSRRRNIPVIVILSQASAARKVHVDALRTTWPAVHFLLLPSAAQSAGAWADELGVPLLAPPLSAKEWQSAVDEEARLMAECAQTRSDLARGA